MIVIAAAEICLNNYNSAEQFQESYCRNVSLSIQVRNISLIYPIIQCIRTKLHIIELVIRCIDRVTLYNKISKMSKIAD